MPLTQAQKSSAFRKRRDAKLKRYEAALRWITANSNEAAVLGMAREALHGSERGEAGR